MSGGAAREYLCQGRVGPIAESVLRSPVKWVGGKGRIRRWIIANMPYHEVYVEPFFGAGWVFFAKAPSRTEVINDLDGRIPALFKAIRDCDLDELRRRLEWTEFSREVVAEAHKVWRAYLSGAKVADVEFAWAMIVEGALSPHGVYHGNPQFSMKGQRDHNLIFRLSDALGAVRARLQGVQIENKDAFEVLSYGDRPEAVVYCDPPYLKSGGGTWGHYNEDETTPEWHERFLGAVTSLRGMVLVSGYPSELYERVLERENGWTRLEKVARVTVSSTKLGRTMLATECLWLNPAAVRAIEDERMALFTARKAKTQ